MVKYKKKIRIRLFVIWDTKTTKKCNKTQFLRKNLNIVYK